MVENLRLQNCQQLKALVIFKITIIVFDTDFTKKNCSALSVFGPVKIPDHNLIITSSLPKLTCVLGFIIY